MKLTIFGATGGIGRQVVRQALDRGDTVTAVVRDASRLEVRHPSLEIAVIPDLSETALVDSALHAADATLSAIGPKGRKDGPVASPATRGIITALDAGNVRRFIAVSAAPVGPPAVGDSFFNRRIVMPMIGSILRPVYEDLAEMETALAASDLDWTLVRPPKLTDGALTGRYRTVIGGNVPRAFSISRSDVAHAMLTALDRPETVRKAIGLAY